MTNIAFSFDDGRKDNYIVAKEILKPLNIPASFNITIGYVENKIKEDKGTTRILTQSKKGNDIIKNIKKVRNYNDLKKNNLKKI